MTLPLWHVTQRRSEAGLRRWCGLVKEGFHPLLASDRLVPVVRIKGLPDWRAGDAHTFHAADERAGDWWSAPGEQRWGELLLSEPPSLVWIRESLPDAGTGTVGRSFGIFRLERVILTGQVFHVRTAEQVAEVR